MRQVDLLSETVAYISPNETIDVVLDRLAPGSTTRLESRVELTVEDPDKDAEDANALISVKQLIGGIFDVFDPEDSITAQAEHFHRVFLVHA